MQVKTFRFGPQEWILTFHGDERASNTAALAFSAATDIVETMLASHEKLTSNDELNNKGRQRRLSSVYAEAVKKFDTFAGSVSVAGEKARAELADLIGSAVPTLEPGDAAGAALDREIRDWLRGLTPDERNRALARASEGKSPELCAAILRAPDFLMPVIPQRRELLRHAYMTPEALKQRSAIEERMQGLNDAAVALARARDAARAIAGLTSSQARELVAEPSEPEQPAEAA